MGVSNGRASDNHAIDIASVSKTYPGRVHALQQVSLQVGEGEIFGLLGPNGAGKSTLVKILMTIVRATSCEGRMLRRPIGEKGVLRKVGYLPEQHLLPGYLTGAQVLDFYSTLAGVPRRRRKKRIGMLLELVDMTDWAKVRVKGYSKGMRQRIGLAQALMSNPSLVLLDEPTDGVDPVGRREIRNILQRLKSQGTTVFINSHILSELEQVCDRVAILVQGKLARQGTLEDLTKGQERYEITISVPEEDGREKVNVAEVIPAKLEALPANPNALEDTITQHRRGGRPSHQGRLNTGPEVEVRPKRITVFSSSPDCIQPMLAALTLKGVSIHSVQPIRPSLEDLFMQAVLDPETGEIRHTGAERGNPQPSSEAAKKN